MPRKSITNEIDSEREREFLNALLLPMHVYVDTFADIFTIKSQVIKTKRWSGSGRYQTYGKGIEGLLPLSLSSSVPS